MQTSSSTARAPEPIAPQGGRGPSAPRGVQVPSAPRGVQVPSAPRGVQVPSAPRGVQAPPAPHGRWRLRAPRDPRWLQIAFLASFLCAGLAARDFPAWHAPLVFAACLATQHLFTRALRIADAGWLSPVITAFGLTLLLRSDLSWPYLLAAIVAIATKFLVRVNGRHFLNPANAGLCAALLATPHAWCSPAQWGESAALLLWVLALGLAVSHRAFRSDASLSFLAAYVALKAARVLWLGQPVPVLAHQLASGSLLLFAFFMISDPKTTPRARPARIGFAVAVACIAFAMQLHFINNAVIWALLVCAPLTPLLDSLAKEDTCPRQSSSSLSW